MIGLTMTSPEQDDRLAYVRHWQRVGPLLAKIHDEELRLMDAATAREIAEAVLDLAELAPCQSTTSGLVEQQRIFQKLRR